MKDLQKTSAVSGFSLIEMLIVLSISSIGFMAITASVIAASRTNRITEISDQALMWGQDLTEIMAGIPLDAPDLEAGNVRTMIRGDKKAEITVFGASDGDNDGRTDFKTIGLKVWVKRGDAFSLRMENYYRRARAN